MLAKKLIGALFSRLKNGGVQITYWDGDTRTYGPAEPYFHLYFKSQKAVYAIFKNISLGFGESYTKGLIEVEGPLEGVVRLSAENSGTFAGLHKILNIPRLHKNTRATQKGYIAHHYDLGNDFYKLWLDKSMTYSCAYFKSPADSLEQAQKNKVEHILKKLQIKEGQSLLDIGSGWGTLLITAAKNYGAIGHGVTLSEEQFAYATKAAKKSEVTDKVTFEIANYQELAERGRTFDRIVSVGMFEHVGRNNHKSYYRAIDRLLKPDGISVLHTITQQTELPCDPWIDKYIFPGGYLPSTREILRAFPQYNFRLTDYENLRIHYAMTLDEWRRRYQKQRTEVLRRFDEEFYRMWDFWLACSSASFRYASLDLSQFVFTKGPQNNLPLTRNFLYN